MTDLETLDVGELADVLHTTAGCVRKTLCVAPHRLPPRLHLPDSSRVLWLRSTVREWLEQHQSPAPKRGRPRQSWQQALAALD